QIKSYLEQEMVSFTKKDRFEEIPSTEEFCQFISDKMEGAELDKMLEYLRDNPEAQNLVARARTLIADEGISGVENPPAQWVKQAKNLFQKSMVAQCPYC